jgi:hypothetical protein
LRERARKSGAVGGSEDPVPPGFRLGLRVSSFPLPVRRLLWWSALNLSGQYRAGIFGRFGVSVVASFGAAGSNRKSGAFGGLLAASVVVSQGLFAYAFVSVWCFFAALLSLLLCYFFASRTPPTPGERRCNPERLA